MESFIAEELESQKKLQRKIFLSRVAILAPLFLIIYQNCP